MCLRSSSPGGVRFLASIRQGNSLNSSARACGIHKEVGYRWVHESYLQRPKEGTSPAQATPSNGFTTARLPAWEAAVGEVTGRHHLKVNVEVESVFWEVFDRGQSPTQSAVVAVAGRSIAYRWIQARFHQFQSQKITLKRCQRLLRLRVRIAPQRRPRKVTVPPRRLRQIIKDWPLWSRYGHFYASENIIPIRDHSGVE
ncbi:hypothetical protein SAMN04489740_4259 [Arthrobacter alpinus]|uniref:Uncharacterized protein n=1 Tax=Arthrobacter alpinus TaxID=656366 RepID=A0A1H5PHK7_9MICC|nr:hypothetical protein SAMN04489740_4259 [Arthrobacter alpinus]